TSTTFTPCGADDVNDENIANAMQLCFEIRAIKDGEEVDDIDMERIKEEAGAAQVKAEYNEAWKRFRDLSEDLKDRCRGDTPWIKLPMPEDKPRKTAKELIRHSQKVGCRAKLYVHKLKAGSDVEPAYEAKRRQKLVRLTHYYKHQGHVLGDGNDFQYLRISSRMNNKIWDLTDAGLDVRHIRSNLMASSGDL
ncbi:hypothetical protein BGZ50_000272, partial [Haplosporangium sp. Z 11]